MRLPCACTPGSAYCETEVCALMRCHRLVNNTPNQALSMRAPACHRAARTVHKAAFRLPCSPGRLKAIPCRAAASTALPDSQAPSASKITDTKVYLRTNWPKAWLHGSVAGGSWKDVPMTPVRLLWVNRSLGHSGRMSQSGRKRARDREMCHAGRTLSGLRTRIRPVNQTAYESWGKASL